MLLFGLTLVVNHACNLRCSYCYTGAKFHAPMPLEYGDHAIGRALATLRPGGTLNLSFFGGEPLLESARIRHWMGTAREAAQLQDKQVRFNLTTNGTVVDDGAMGLMMDPEIELAVSCDGTADSHNRHRVDTGGRGSFPQVEGSLRKLIAAERAFSVLMVVRPDTVDALTAGLTHLRALGVTRFVLSLDIWTAWDPSALTNLALAVEAAADLWAAWLPAVSIGWFDLEIATLAGLVGAESGTRCGFGEGEIAVAPSGRLYPCERIIGDDLPGHPLLLPGLVNEGDDFRAIRSPCAGAADPGAQCDFCRCSSFVRTGSTAAQNSLDRVLKEAVHHAIKRIINSKRSRPPAEGTSYGY